MANPVAIIENSRQKENESRSQMRNENAGALVAEDGKELLSIGKERRPHFHLQLEL